MFDGVVDQLLQIFLAVDVAGERDRFAAFVLDGLDHFLARIELAAADHDFRAVFRHALCDGAADAAARAGDHCDFAGEIEQSGSHDARLVVDGLDDNQAPVRLIPGIKKSTVKCGSAWY